MQSWNRNLFEIKVKLTVYQMILNRNHIKTNDFENQKFECIINIVHIKNLPF